MSSADPKREFAIAVVRRLQEAGHRALWAGGCVRDFLLGRVPKDYDVATDAHPPIVREIFGQRRTLAVGASFGVIIVIGSKDAGNVEIATFRTEGPYLDGRRPEHVSFSGPEEDAQRRDFTINGMFYDPIAETVHDYVGGEADLGAGVIRAIGNPADRMAEDKLRLLRAVRFAATMDFQIEPATAAAVRNMAHEIHAVSAERIAQELRNLLVDRHRRRGVELTRELGLLAEILPEVAAESSQTPAANDSGWQRALNRLHALSEPLFELACAALLYGPPESARMRSAPAICKRLRLSNQETDTIVWLLRHLGDVAASQEKSLAELKRLLVHPSAHELIELARVDALAGNADLSPVMHCEEFLLNTPPDRLDPPPLLTGDDLIAMGIKPGKSFRTILDSVRDAQLNEEISTRDEAMELARQLLGLNP
jgi:poly(A) polymerase